MSSLKFLAVLVIAVALVGGTVALGVLTYGREALWADLFGPPDLGPYAFDKPTRTGKPNDALACPVGGCKEAGRILDTQIFAVEPQVLYAALREEIDDAFIASFVEEAPERGYLRAVIYTPLLRLPDTLSAEVRPAGPGRAAVFLYSRSQIGHADLGTNEERLRVLLRHLRWTLPRVAPDGTTVPARKDQQVAPDGGAEAAPAVSAPAEPQAAPAPAAPSTSGRLLQTGPAIRPG